jgi:hypothetical protein
VLPVRPILDPRDVSPCGGWVPPGPLPPATRAFGAVPDFSAIQPGDLLLVTALKPGLVARGIRAIQTRGGYAAADAQWTHATIYTGNGRVVEATRSGVHPTAMYKYLTGGHLLLFRRSPDLTLEQGYQVAIRALEKCGRRYDNYSAVLLGLHAAFFGLWQTPPWQPPRSTCICSMLFADAFSWVTGKTIENRESGEVTPAFLSQTQSLVDVPVTWHRIVPATALAKTERADEDDRAQE